jgi:hypothetical protein
MAYRLSAHLTDRCGRSSRDWTEDEHRQPTRTTSQAHADASIAIATKHSSATSTVSMIYWFAQYLISLSPCPTTPRSTPTITASSRI